MTWRGSPQALGKLSGEQGVRLKAARLEETGRRAIWVCLVYLAVTLALSAVGLAWVVRWNGGAGRAVAGGAATAWAIQAVAFWRLVLALHRKHEVLRVWVVGIGARAGGLVLMFAVGATSGMPTQALLLGYGVEIVALLLLEAAWLAVAGPSWRGSSSTT